MAPGLMTDAFDRIHAAHHTIYRKFGVAEQARV